MVDIDLLMYKYKKIKAKDGSTYDEHRKIADALGLGVNTIVHHIDGDKKNNTKENLEVMTRSEHAILHGLGTKIRPTKMFFPDSNGFAVCRVCGELKEFELFKKDCTWASGRRSTCYVCANRKRRERYKNTGKTCGPEVTGQTLRR